MGEGTYRKEARMNIKRNFWKQGPLLAGLLCDSLMMKR